MKKNNAASGISIILVDTRTPANIGAVARAMMNMGLNRLVLVDPPPDRTGEAFKLAAGAESILDSAATFPSLKEALADQSIAIGVSRHRGRLRKNIHSPREAASRLLPLLGTNRIAVVFGNEVNGLEKEHLALCQEFISIPSSAAFPSLNLSHAVMVIAYELFVATAGSALSAPRQPAAGKELEDFYSHLRSVLETTGFLDPNNPDRMMFSLRQLFGRSQPDSREVKILRGILSTVERSVRCRQKQV